MDRPYAQYELKRLAEDFGQLAIDAMPSTVDDGFVWDSARLAAHYGAQLLRWREWQEQQQ